MRDGVMGNNHLSYIEESYVVSNGHLCLDALGPTTADKMRAAGG